MTTPIILKWREDAYECIQRLEERGEEVEIPSDFILGYIEAMKQSQRELTGLRADIYKLLADKQVY